MSAEDMRDVDIEPRFLENPAGSVLISFGMTRVLCTITVEDSVPPWLMKDGVALQGWLTATYNMLPASGGIRIRRERRGPKGRTHEIERLIGRSLRTAVDLKKVGERTFWVDCDVLQADGGTRTASITGAWVALRIALNKLLEMGTIPKDPMLRQVAAVSVGIVKGSPVLDLCYKEDSSAEVDMNVVMDGEENIIEVQATGEEAVFSRKQLDRLMDLATKGIRDILDLQKEAI
ncbi:MAG: ribonuclease PH [Thermoplasmatota archaeon]